VVLVSQPTLFSYENVEAPVLHERFPVRHPQRPKVIMGFIADIENRDGRGFVAQRYREECAEHKQDYFRKVGGYSMVKDLIDLLIANGVTYVFIEEMDTETLIEYQSADFPINGVEVPDVNGHEQWCLPVACAIHTWNNDYTIHHACS
jgi:hypothetical protein